MAGKPDPKKVDPKAAATAKGAPQKVRKTQKLPMSNKCSFRARYLDAKPT